MGVHAVIFGTVTEFAVDRQSSGGAVGFFGVTAGTDSEEANVCLNARMVSTSTAEILAVPEGTGAADQSDTSVFILGTGGGSSTDIAIAFKTETESGDVALMYLRWAVSFLTQKAITPNDY